MAKQAIIKNLDELPAVFDIDTFAWLFKDSRENVRRLCKEGKLPAFRHGKKYLFKKVAVEKYMDDNNVMKLEQAQERAAQ